MSAPRPIFLLTDFGPGGYYQGVMRGVIAGIAPESAVHDLTHGVTPGDVNEAAFILEASLDHLPADVVAVVVVDPGVGGDRRILAARFGDRLVLAPDNGVLTRVLSRSDLAEVRRLSNERLRLEKVSATFHGRDVFAPAAAHLARGFPFREAGPEVGDPVRVGREAPGAGSDTGEQPVLVAQVIHVDPFGNLVTDVTRDEWIRRVGSPAFRIQAGPVTLTRLMRTFSDVRSGEPLAYMGSTENLELAIRDGNAAAAWGMGTGDEIRVFKD